MTTVNTICQHEQRLIKRALGHCRAAIDAFVSNRMQDAVSQDGYFDAKESQGSENEIACVAPPDHSKTFGVELKPLDEDVLSPAIPAFFIGRNKAGLWVARKSTGQIGGLFLLKRSALAFARTQSDLAGCALVIPSEKFELDVENEGNPFARYFESLLRFGRKIARCVLTAVLALLILAGIAALQAAIHVHVYLWRLVG